jgi:hypothetical protein
MMVGADKHLIFNILLGADGKVSLDSRNRGIGSVSSSPILFVRVLKEVLELQRIWCWTYLSWLLLEVSEGE